MNVIDLEILIPASPDFIWRFLGDITKTVDWQEGVRSISFLTTQHEGKGTRWRYTYGRGNDIIAEVGAWYDTLGYEYRIVEGGGFGENQGRIRLTEVPDGTIVRWTFNYALSGVLGGLRNAMRHKRSTSKSIQDSLRNLHRLVQQESGGISTHQARAAVRDAPDADERSIYQPRHPTAYVDSASGDTTELIDDDLQEPAPFGFEHATGPLSSAPETDTKPNPVVQTGEDLAVEVPANGIEDATKPIEMEIIAYPPADLAEAPKSATQPTDRSTEIPESEEAPRVAKPIEKRSVDTSTISVFELFGLERPSQSGEPADRAALTGPSQPARTVADAVDDMPMIDEVLRRDPLPEVNIAETAIPGDSGGVAAEDFVVEDDEQRQRIIGRRRYSRRRRYRLRSHGA